MEVFFKMNVIKFVSRNKLTKSTSEQLQDNAYKSYS